MLKEKISKLLAKGETKSALNILLAEIEGEQKKEVIVLSNRYSEVKKKQRLGIISFREDEIELNKINISILDLIDNIEDNFKTNHSNVQIIREKESNRTKNNLAKIVTAVCAIIIISLTVFIQIKESIVSKEAAEGSFENLEQSPYGIKFNEQTNGYLGELNDSNRQGNLPIENDENIKPENEILTIANQIVNNVSMENNGLDKLVKEKKYDEALKALDMARSKTNDSIKLNNIDNRRRSILLIQEKGFDNVWFSFPRTLVLTQKNNKYGLYDRVGNEICKPIFDEIDPIFFGELYCTKLDNKFGFFTQEGKEIFQPIFSDVDPIQYIPMMSITKNGLIGFIDQEGNIILKPFYNEATRVWVNTIFVKKNNLWGVIDTLGQEIIRPKYDSIEFIDTEETIYATAGGKGVYYNEKGKIIKNPAFKN